MAVAAHRLRGHGRHRGARGGPPGRARCSRRAGAKADHSQADHSQAEDGRTVCLTAGRFEWIDTGDPMPAGADTVIVRERLLPRADGSVVVTPASGAGQRAGRAVRGRNVRTAGEDFRAGEALLPAGRRLRPGDLAAAAAGGHAAVTVARRPVVAIIPTGDEIRPVGTVPRFGDIIDTNSLMLAARCRQLGAESLVSAVVPDDPDALAVELRHAAGRADLVLVIAGSSRGRGDHAAAVLAQVGGVAVAGVAVRPGHPALLGHAKRPEAGIAPVIGLPGYPLATAVIFELYAVPVLAALSGLAPGRPAVRARLDRDWSSPADVEDWVLVRLAPAGRARFPSPRPAGAARPRSASSPGPTPGGRSPPASARLPSAAPSRCCRSPGPERARVPADPAGAAPTASWGPSPATAGAPAACRRPRLLAVTRPGQGCRPPAALDLRWRVSRARPSRSGRRGCAGPSWRP